MTTAGHRFDACAMREAIAQGAMSAESAVQACLDRIAADHQTRAFLHVDAEGALAQAVSVDRRRSQGRRLGRLAGVPVAIKDNLCARAMPTTCGSRILAGYRPPYDAHVVARLRAEDAVIIGKTNMDEFAMGSSSENSAFGAVRNPWHLAHAPGGSSGGSAVAVAAGFVPLALGSDTGGSVRQPGAFCGVTALKPTYGRVSRYGLVAFGSSLDQVGPMARSARDAAVMLQVIAGHDARDATCSPSPVPDYGLACGKSPEGLRIGVVREAFGEGTAPGVAACVEASLAQLTDLGCELLDVELPHADKAVSVYYLVAAAEASSNLARFDGMRYGLRVAGGGLRETYEATRGQGFGREVKRRIMLGTYALSAGYYDAYYLRAARVRSLIRADFDEALSRCDLIATPTAPTAAFRLGDKLDDPLAMYMSDQLTLPASLAGLPAVSVPCGFDGDLPVGLQLVGRPFDEAGLLRVADAYQGATDWHRRQPVVPFQT